jgi:predicted PurR-regulated permease PerM
VIDPAGKQIESWLSENLSSILQFTVRTTGDAVTFIGRLIGSAIYIAFLLFLIPFYFYFFSTSWPHLRRFVRETLPPKHFEDAYTLVEKMDLAISGFVRGRIVISAIMGVLLAIGWGICGVPYWMIVGLTTGVLCAVPYLGGAGLPLAIVLLWLGQGDLAPDQQMAWWGIILWPSLVFGVVQVIESYGLTPYIAGKATNLGPVSILVAVLAGGVVAGVYGMLLAIPVAACLKIVMTDALLPRVQRWARGQAQDILPIDEQY